LLSLLLLGVQLLHVVVGHLLLTNRQNLVQLVSRRPLSRPHLLTVLGHQLLHLLLLQLFGLGALGSSPTPCFLLSFGVGGVSGIGGSSLDLSRSIDSTIPPSLPLRASRRPPSTNTLRQHLLQCIILPVFL